MHKEFEDSGKSPAQGANGCGVALYVWCVILFAGEPAYLVLMPTSGEGSTTEQCGGQAEFEKDLSSDSVLCLTCQTKDVNGKLMKP